MKRFMPTLIAAAAVALGIPCGAEEDQSRPSCQTSTLKGTYVVTISGTRPAPRVLPGLAGTPGTIESVTGVLLQIFDGNGSFHQALPVTVKGALSGLFPDQPGTGTYEVAPNCTGSFTVNIPQLPAPLENRLVVFDQGRRFRSVVTSPQTLMIQVEGKRID